MAILTARASIVGTRPILWHRFGPDSIPLEKQERTGVAGNDPEEWRKTVLVDRDGRLYLEPTYIFGCLVNGARYTKKGRGSIQASVAATLQVMDDRIYVDRTLPAEPTMDPDQPVYIHVASVRNPQTRGRNVRYRVCANTGWRATFRIMWDGTMVSRQVMKNVLEDAARFVGLADGRAVGYGRFAVEAFEVEEASDAKAEAAN